MPEVSRFFGIIIRFYWNDLSHRTFTLCMASMRR